MTKLVLCAGKKILPVVMLFFMASIGWPLHAETVVSAKTDRPRKIVLQLKWRHQFQFAGYYIAQEKGFYSERDLEVTFNEAKNQKDVTQAVLEGKAHFGIASSDLIIARANHKKVIALAAIFQHSPLVFLTLKSTKIQNPADLIGKRVMLENHAAELAAYLKDEGVALDQLHLLPHTLSIDPLLTGQADAMSAYTTDEPYMLLKKGIPYQLMSPRAAAIDLYADVLFTTEDMISRNPQVVHHFLQASLRGWNYAFENLETTLDLIIRKYKARHSREHLRFEAEGMRELVVPERGHIGDMSRERWEHIAHTYARMGMIPENFSLKGFLYKDDRRIVFRWSLAILVGAAVILATLILVGFSELFAKARIPLSELFGRFRAISFRSPGGSSNEQN